MCGGGAAKPGCTYCPGCMYGSSPKLLPPGDPPVIWFGEFQLLAVAGDVAGESSLLRLRLAEFNGGGMLSSPGGFFLRCPRCFSSMLNNPSLVNGLGKTSFMPNQNLALS